MEGASWEDRGVFGALLSASVALGAPVAAAEAEESGPQEGAIELWTGRSWFALAGVDLLRPTTLRLGALRAWERSSHDPDGFMAIGMFGVGPRLDLVLPRDEEAAALGLSAVARFATLGDGGPIGMELSLGGLSNGQDSAAVFGAGAYLSLYYADVGYLVQVPLLGDAPGETVLHGVSLRVAVPVRRVGEPEELGPFGGGRLED